MFKMLKRKALLKFIILNDIPIPTYLLYYANIISNRSCTQNYILFQYFSNFDIISLLYVMIRK